MDFNNKVLHVFHIGGVDVWITQTVVSTWIIMGILVAFAVIVRIKLRKFKEIPETNFQNIVETMVETFENFVKNSAGDRVSYIGNWFFMVFAFILTSNLSGLIGLKPPTSDWNTTFALALATFFLIEYAGFRHQGRKYAKNFINPMNIIGELARPVSLSFRLFGNVLSGVILMGLFYALTPIFVQFVIPSALHAFFDVFVGAIQTYIFTVLSLTFIGVAAEDPA